MSEIKPVYQVRQLGEWIEVEKHIFDELYIQNKFPHRILYPASDYEAQRNEVERQSNEIANLKAEIQALKLAQSKDAVDYWDLVGASADRAKQITGLKAENEELRHVNLTSLADLHFKNRELESKNEAQAKRIEELEEKDEMLNDMLDLLKINKENWFNLYSAVAELKSKNGE